MDKVRIYCDTEIRSKPTSVTMYALSYDGSSSNQVGLMIVNLSLINTEVHFRQQWCFERCLEIFVSKKVIKLIQR